MKRCPHCGSEYPEGEFCAIDGEILVETFPQPPSPAPSDQAAKPSANDVPHLALPDSQWKARDAWKCLAVILVFQIMLLPVFGTWNGYYFVNRGWYMTGCGHFLGGVLSCVLQLFVVAYFARTESFASLWQALGLDHKPSSLAWWGVAMALIIRGFGHWMIILGWEKGVSDSDLRGFQHSHGLESLLYLMPLIVLAPLFEESIYRGFLYKAFRGSYFTSLSMLLIVAWTAFSHWPQYSHSAAAVVALSMLTVVQCYLREKSASLWDCVLCHFVFNASVFL